MKQTMRQRLAVWKHPIDQKTKMWFNKTRHFLKKHERWTTVLAAALVFATFVAKDVWREESKDFIDDVEKALAQFKFDKNTSKTIGVNPTVLCDRVYQPLGEVNNIMAFANRVPTIPVHDAAFKLADNLGKWFRECGNLDEKDTQKFTALAVDLSAMSTEALTMETHVEFEADDLIRESKKRYDKWRKATYFLYAFGWGVTLFGKVAGVSSLKTGD